MTSPSPEQQQYIAELGRIYHEILPLEQELRLYVSDRDQRPRVDYFFDAVRALTDNNMPTDKRLERLSLEWLAYDATAIRYLENKPLAVLNPNRRHQSPETRLVRQKTGAVSAKRAANRDDKDFLSKNYLRFGVIFVALFKPFADRDHRDRVEEMDEQVQELSTIKQAMEGLGQGSASVSDLEAAAMHSADPELQKLVKNLIAKKRYKDSVHLGQALDSISELMGSRDEEIAALQTAHLDFATSQLALYETGKHVVKDLAGQGLNVAGQHTTTALNQPQDIGRGR